MNAKSTIRWLVIAALGCYSVFALVGIGSDLLARGDAHWASFLFVLGYSSLFIAVAYLVFRRRYRTVCTMGAVLAAVVVFGFLNSLPVRFGLYEWLDTWSYSEWSFSPLPLFLLAYVIPFCGAGWAYHHVQTFLSRFIHSGAAPKQAA